MEILNLNIESKFINKKQEVNVLIPTNYNQDTKCLMLLHGLGGDHNHYFDKSDIKKIAEDNNLVVILPNGDRAFYGYTKDNKDYVSFIQLEVWNEVAKRLSINLEQIDKYISGISMGGYGAFLIGLNYPEFYRGISSLSGSLDIISRDNEKRLDSRFAEEWNSLFGDVMSEKMDLFNLIKPFSGRIFIMCGNEDYLFNYNQKFVNALMDNKVDFIFETKQGEHNWEFFKPNLKKTIETIIN